MNSTELARLPGLSTHLWWTAWHRSGAVLPIAFASTPETLCLIDRTGDVVLRFAGHTRGINAAAWSPDFASLATASWDGTARLWSGDGSCTRTLGPFPEAVESIDFSPDGAALLLALRDRTVRRVAIGGGDAVTLLALDCQPSRAAYDGAGARIAVATEADEALVLPAAGGEPLRLPHPGTVYSLAWNDRGRLATACDDGVIRVFDPTAGPTPIAESEPSRARALQVAWQPGGAHLAAGFREGVARILDEDLHERHAIDNPKEVTVLAWTPAADIIAVGSGRGDLALHAIEW